MLISENGPFRMFGSLPWAPQAEKITAAAISPPPRAYLTTFYNRAELWDQISFYHSADPYRDPQTWPIEGQLKTREGHI